MLEKQHIDEEIEELTVILDKRRLENEKIFQKKKLYDGMMEEIQQNAKAEMTLSKTVSVLTETNNSNMWYMQSKIKPVK